MTGNENPFFEHYDELLDILYEYDVTIFARRRAAPWLRERLHRRGPGKRLVELGLLPRAAWERNAVAIEGPGHQRSTKSRHQANREKPCATTRCSTCWCRW